MAFERIIPQDIKFQYATDKFSVVRQILEDQSRLSYTEILLILALIGVETRNNVPLNTNDGKSEHTISRTVYSRNSTQLDTYYGLITILANMDDEYNKVLNEMAFAKNTENDTKYIDLVNVQTFYTYYLGGIEHIYDVINSIDKDSIESVFDSLYDYVMDDIDETLEVYDKLKQLEEAEVMYDN